MLFWVVRLEFTWRVPLAPTVTAPLPTALLAVVRKLLIFDVATTDASQLFALAAAILALGAVYWLVRAEEPRARAFRRAAEREGTDLPQPRRDHA